MLNFSIKSKFYYWNDHFYDPPKKQKTYVYIMRWVTVCLHTNVQNFKVITLTNEYSVRQWSGRPGFNTSSSHTKDFKMVLDATLFNTLHYEVQIKSKVCNPGNGIALSPTRRCCSIEKGTFRSPSTKVANFTYFTYIDTVRSKKNRQFFAYI